MIIVLLADGFEEIEALTPVDMLRRAGLNVKTVGVTGRAPTGAHGIAVICDATPDEIDLSKVTMAIFPGGMPGATNLDNSPYTDRVISAVKKNGGHLAAICAAPLIFGKRGLLEGKNATCYPGFEKELKGATISESGCITDGNITTAKAMGSALDFAEELISICKTRKKAEEISAAIYRNEPVTVTITVEKEVPAAKKTKTDFLSQLEKKFSEPEVVEKIDFTPKDYSDYTLPPLDLLTMDNGADIDAKNGEIDRVGKQLLAIMKDFGVKATIGGAQRGPRLTRYEIVPEKGTKVSQILNLIDDIALGLGVGSIRMEAPIPGKSCVGIEVPNEKAYLVRLGDLINSDEFKASKSVTTSALGMDIVGKPVFQDIKSTPHMLISGSAGMGKTVCVNSILISTLYKASPDQLKLILIDPKQVEFTPYKNLPHLLMPVLYDPKDAAAALLWVNEEMERRYKLFSETSVRNLEAYNEKVDKADALPRIVVVIDEFADLMLQVKDPVEPLVMRIAQKARAAGIHMIICTQRPSVNVITGVIKANIPTRLSCKLSSNVDSRTLLDMGGAEKLLGRGDALFAPMGYPKPYRIQCAYVSDDEVEAVTDHIKNTAGEAVYDPNVLAFVEAEANKLKKPSARSSEAEEPSAEGYLNDRQFLDAVEVAVNTRKISTSLIQRKLSIGYGKAAKFIDIMEDMGIVGEANGQRPREVLLTPDEWKAKLARISLED